MLPDHLVSLFIRKEIRSDARRIIDYIRSAEPSRRVNSGRGNTPGVYPSKKMGVTIQFESYKVELAAIYEKEHDPKVYEYYDQPPPIKIKYQIEGRNSGRIYHPDFFVISEDFIGWEEWKEEEELIKQSIEKPYLYIRSDDGTWYIPPAEEYARQYGLSFRVRSSKDIDWIYLSNIRFLEDYLLQDIVEVDDKAKNIILSKVAEQPGVTIKELLDDQSGYNSDDIYKLIVCDEIYFDPYKSRITERDRAKLYPNKEMAHAYSFLEASSGVEPINVTDALSCPEIDVIWCPKVDASFA